MKGVYHNLWDAAKTGLKGKFVALKSLCITGYKRTELRCHLHKLKKLEKEQVKFSKWEKKKVKISAIGNRHTIEKRQ